MTTEASRVGLHDHERFLQSYPPYAALGAQALGEFVRDLEIVYRPAGAALDLSGGLFVVRRGALDLGGEEFGEGETLGGGVRTGTAWAQRDTWLYVLPPERAERWLRLPALRDFLTSALSVRLTGESRAGAGLDLSTAPVGEVMRPAVLGSPGMTVQQAPPPACARNASAAC